MDIARSVRNLGQTRMTFAVGIIRNHNHYSEVLLLKQGDR